MRGLQGILVRVRTVPYKDLLSEEESDHDLACGMQENTRSILGLCVPGLAIHVDATTQKFKWGRSTYTPEA